MRIVVDGQALQSASRFRGIGRYANSWLRAAVQAGTDHEFILALSSLFPDTIDGIRAEFGELLTQDSIRIWDAPGPTCAVVPGNRWRRRTAEVIRETFLASLDPDWILVPSLFEGFVDDTVTSVGAVGASAPVAVICHDLIPHLFPDLYLSDPHVRAWYEEKLAHLGRADLWLSNSAATRDDVIEHLGYPAASIVNISAAAGDEWAANGSVPPDTASQLRQRYGLRGSFVMYTGGDDPRKNIDGLIRAYAALPRKRRSALQLAIIGKIEPARQKEMMRHAAACGLARREMVVTDYVPDEDLRDLYRLCDVFVFPSLYEGFGLPILEAMQSGRAVIGSDNSSIRDVIGREDALFDASSTESIRDKLEAVLEDTDFRGELERHGLARARLFSWEASARKSLSAMEAARRPGADAVGAVPGRRRRGKPRLAYFSPLPPDRSGISDYSAEVIPELSKTYAVEVVVDGTEVTDPWIREHCPIRSVEWFQDNPEHFDRILYQMGNSAFHRHMLGLLEDFPGVVVLHDFYLSDKLSYLELTGYRPGISTEYLYRSHGYAALAARGGLGDRPGSATDFPCNFPVLENALHVVSHSEHARDLVQDWYPRYPLNRWSVLALPREDPGPVDKSAAREALGVPEDAFVVCSFGSVTPEKQYPRLIDGWLGSDLSRAANSYLVLAGGTPDEKYAESLATAISERGAEGSIHLTGHLDGDTYRCWLAAADMGVQLRGNSRGETSAAALDCMAWGLPTIVNAHGSLREIPTHCVRHLPDDYDDGDLVRALEDLWRDPALRQNLGDAARALIRSAHSPGSYAADLAAVLEGAFRGPAGKVAALPAALAAVEPRPDTEDEYARLAAAVARSFPATAANRQILIDVSILVQGDAKSGIQRVVRSILSELLNNPPKGYRVEPVFATRVAGYRYARDFTTRFMELPGTNLEDEPLDVAPGDVFVMLDLHHAATFHRAELQGLRGLGVAVWAVVYDLLPLHLPQYFPPELKNLHESWVRLVAEIDGAVCISASVASELEEWIEANIPAGDRRVDIRSFHLGADIEASEPTFGMPADAERILARLSESASFLMVGTLEPRKGHAQTLAAFEHLWRQGQDATLVIVGKQGWQVDRLAARLRDHPENGSRLFWLHDASDEYLDKIYAASSALLAASEGEGFGLPLIEAARHGVPIIARDLPVFREVGGDHAFYFQGPKPGDLAEAILVWLSRRDEAEGVPESTGMPWLSWAESTKNLLDIILDKRREEPSLDAGAPPAGYARAGMGAP